MMSRYTMKHVNKKHNCISFFSICDSKGVKRSLVSRLVVHFLPLEEYHNITMERMLEDLLILTSHCPRTIVIIEVDFEVIS